MSSIALFVILSVFVFVTAKSGHKRAVQMSEASLRDKFDKGLSSPEARKLMRDAGYNV